MSASVLLRRITRTSFRATLEDVQDFAEQVWAGERLLEGFTDHGPDHAFRVIDRVEEFLQDPCLLSEDEAFVLLSACWLHDVCMQDYGLLEEASPERYVDSPIQPDERDLIRTQHARRVCDLLYAHKSILIRDGQHHEHRPFPSLETATRYVAEVVCGHSTSGFQRARHIRNDRGPTGRDNFRLALLAALLLLGDECDLDKARADGYIDSAGVERLRPSSALHHLKHRYVAQSRIVVSCANPNYRQLELCCNWPEGYDVRTDFRRWIESKLLVQINLVHPTVRKELGIEFDPSKPFRIQEPSTQMRVEEPPAHVVQLLQAERVRMDLADLERQIEQVLDELDSTAVYVLVEPEGPGQFGAREIALIAISELRRREVRAGKGPYRLEEIDVTDDPTACDPFALLQRIAGIDLFSSKNLLGREDAFEMGFWQIEQAPRLLEQGIEDRSPTIALLCNVHELPLPSKQLLARCLIPFACEHKEAMRLFVTTGFVEDILPETELDARIKLWEMPDVGREDVLTMLERHTLHPIDLRERHVRQLFGNQKHACSQSEARCVAELLAPEGVCYD